VCAGFIGAHLKIAAPIFRKILKTIEKTVSNGFVRKEGGAV